MNSRLRAQILNGTVLAGVLMLGYIVGHMSGPPPVIQEIAGAVRYVDKQAITSREPDAKVGRIERITKPTVAADYVAIAKGAGDSTVNAFCAIKRDYADSIVSDSTPTGGDNGNQDRNVAPILNRSIRTDSRLFPWQRSSLYAVSVSGSGDLVETRYQVRQGYSLRADSDSLVVQNPRIPVKPLIGAGILVGTGYLIRMVVE